MADLPSLRSFAASGRAALMAAAIVATILTVAATGWELVRAKIAEDRATEAMFAVSEILNNMSDDGTIVFNGMMEATMRPGSVDLQRVAAARGRLNVYMDQLGEYAALDPVQADLFAAADAARERYLVWEAQSLALLMAGQAAEASALMQTPEYYQAAVDVGPQFDALMLGMQEGTRAAYEASDRGEIRSLILAGIGVTVIAILWSLILIDWVRQTRVARRQTEAAREAQARLANMNNELERRVLLRTHELERARDAAEQANKAKSDFLATMSHELRTPLNGVLGMSTVMARTPLTDAQKSMLQVIDTSGKSLLTLLNDLLDYARLETGRIELRQEPFDLTEAIERTATAHRAEAEKKGLELRVAMTPEARGAFVGDEKRLSQIIGNLLSNAVKFTDTGHVAVDAHYRNGRLHVSVSDTGCGVPPALMDRLFERFAQADTSTRRRHGGMGMGLALARELITAMGGEIGVNAQHRSGSEFWFELPLSRWTPAASAGAGEAIRAA